MPRTYDEDGQPMMSNKQMLQMLVKEIPDVYRDLRSQIQESEKRITLEMHEMKLEIRGMKLQTHQNHSSFITNQTDMEKRIAVLETARH